MIDKAIIFATKVHSGQVRKGVPLPYILHPMEVAAIVASLSSDEEVITAAILHDTIEDCEGVTKDIIKQEFGERVASLVQAESEDKAKTWVERKGATILHLQKETNLEVKMLALGDKLANMRSLKRDHKKLGDEIWTCFRQKDPKMIAWYYKGVREGLSELKDTLAYQEYDQLVTEVFGE